MKFNIYTIFDQCSGLYSRPSCDVSDGSAIRQFQDLATSTEDHPVANHPEDYTLYRIGTFDDANGKINPETNSMLATALELVSAARNVNQDNLEQLHTENGIQNGDNLQ